MKQRNPEDYEYVPPGFLSSTNVGMKTCGTFCVLHIKLLQ